MPVNDFNVGKDVSLDIDNGDGPVTFTLVTGFNARQDTVDIKEKGIDGIPRHLTLPDGWSGQFQITRQKDDVDQFFQNLEDQYYAEGDTNMPTMTINQTIAEPNGNVSQYRYEGVQVKLEDAGEWGADTTVKLRVGFVASRRKRVS